MRPDRRRRRADLPIGHPDDAPVPFDVASDPDAPELAALERELAAAGDQARRHRPSTDDDRPRPAFATELRSRLLAAYGTATADGVAAGPAPAASWLAAGSRWAGRSAAARSALGRPARRWAVLAVAAAVVVAVLGSASGRFFPATLEARATEAAGATLVRAGATTALLPGTALRTGDEIRVAPDGRATLGLGAGVARLAGGADLRIDDLAAFGPRLELISGRSYHRVAPPAGGAYTVTTGSLRWTALGTAFELDRAPAGGVGDRVTLLGLQHAVTVAGPNLQATVGEGRAASVHLGTGDASDLAVGPIDPSVLRDRWLVDNALRDRDLGFPLGVMDGFVPGPAASPNPSTAASAPPASGEPTTSATPGATATDEPTEEPTARPTAKPANRATPGPTPEPTPKPTARPTPEPTPKPTPKPTPSPIASFGLDLVSCDGGIVIDWATYVGDQFDHYATLRNTVASIPEAYPPQDGASFVAGTWTRSRLRTSAHDAGLEAGTWYYRSMAFDAADRVIGASPIRSAEARPVGDLGALTVGPGDGSTTVVSWSAYAGPSACFSSAKLVVSKVDPTPSYFEGSPVLFATTAQDISEAVAELGPGTYHLRLQVVRSTDLGRPAKFLVAQTDVATYTVEP